MMAIKKANLDVGGGAIEIGETEFVVRSHGYIRSLEDLENIVVMSSREGTPVLVKHLAEVRLGPEMRRGVAEWNGEGEAVGGIVVMRFGENALATIDAGQGQAGKPQGRSAGRGDDQDRL